jgi:phosphoribosyl 1,2-cyclic phosphodiesterase
MKVTFQGVRGSFPVAAAHFKRYGGNTPCVEIDTGRNSILIDAGTGIRAAGRSLVDRGVADIHLLFSHTHWDHIQGLPHFAPLYQKGTRIHIYGLGHPDRSLYDILQVQQRPPFFPISLDEVPARITCTELEDGQQFAIGATCITCRRLNHPGLTCGYRLECDDRVLTYLCDADLGTDMLLGDHMEFSSSESRQGYLEHLHRSARDLARRADLLICDTFFLPEDYKPEWGHSRPDDALRLALEARAKQLALFHHEPHRDDVQLDAILQRYAPQAAGRSQLLIAAEGTELSL